MNPSPPPRSERTAQRILDAARELLAGSGLRRMSVEGVAKLAGVSHMTVYRRWPSKQSLVAAVLHREVERILAEVDNTLAKDLEPEDAVTDGFTAIFWHFYANPLLTSHYTHDPDTTLRALTTASEGEFGLAVDFLSERILRAHGDSLSMAPRAAAEVFVRITHSLLVTSLKSHPFSSREEVAAWGRQHIRPLMKALLPEGDTGTATDGQT